MPIFQLTQFKKKNSGNPNADNSNSGKNKYIPISSTLTSLKNSGLFWIWMRFLWPLSYVLPGFVLLRNNLTVYNQSNLIINMDLITDNRITCFCGNLNVQWGKIWTLSVFTNLVILIIYLSHWMRTHSQLRSLTHFEELINTKSGMVIKQCSIISRWPVRFTFCIR